MSLTLFGGLAAADTARLKVCRKTSNHPSRNRIHLLLSLSRQRRRSKSITLEETSAPIGFMQRETRSENSIWGCRLDRRVIQEHFSLGFRSSLCLSARKNLVPIIELHQGRGKLGENLWIPFHLCLPGSDFSGNLATPIIKSSSSLRLIVIVRSASFA